VSPTLRKPFRERNLVAVGIASAVVIAAVLVGAINFSRLPLISDTTTYQANFANAAGLAPGDSVTVAGVHVGTVTSLTLAGTVVRVHFTVQRGTPLGTDTGAAARILNPLGVEYLALLPAGPGRLDPARPIPVSRTTVPSTLVGDLNQLAGRTQQLDINELAAAMNAASQALAGTSTSATRAAFSGLATVSEALGSQQEQIASVLAEAHRLVGVLDAHTGALTNLLSQAQSFLAVLDQRRAAITTLLNATDQLATEVDQLLVTNRATLTPLLDDLETVTGVLAKDRASLSQDIPLFASFATYAANLTGQGPFGEFVLPTSLIPDNIIEQCSKPYAIDPGSGCTA
jgi:phospholipid/cholesterol/gamma-HCH transport system substrate-binding protein